MSGNVTPEKTLERLRKEAKRWLKLLREGSPDAKERLTRALGSISGPPTLRDVQLALARELGFSGWAALKSSVDASPPQPGSIQSIVNRFLDNACPDHHVRGAQDHRRAEHTAMRLFEQHPEIASYDFFTAIVCGDLDRVQRAIAANTQLVSARTAGMNPARAGSGGFGDLYNDLGPKGWTPLLYLCFTRLPLAASNENAVAIARLLLEHGADPNAFFPAGGSRYTPLVGAIGEGEEDRPPHPKRDELVALLLAHGAEPYDNQVMYNLGFNADYMWYLPLIQARSLALGRAADWADPEWMMLAMGNYGSGARWLLDHAIKQNNIALAEWCLAHGANPNSPPAKDKRFSQTSLYEQAVRAGREEIAELLARHGAVRSVPKLDPMEEFLAACLRMDRAEVERRIAADPSLLKSPKPLAFAAELDRPDVINMLIDLGTSPEVATDMNERAMHAAAYNNSVAAARALLARGAEIDPYERHYGNSPLNAACHFQNREMIDMLAELSSDVWALAYEGRADRIRAVLEGNPAKALVEWEGQTPLMWLPPHDEDAALAIVKEFERHGADLHKVAKDGTTALARAESMGMTRVAAYLSSAKPK